MTLLIHTAFISIAVANVVCVEYWSCPPFLLESIDIKIHRRQLQVYDIWCEFEQEHIFMPLIGVPRCLITQHKASAYYIVNMSQTVMPYFTDFLQMDYE